MRSTQLELKITAAIVFCPALYCLGTWLFLANLGRTNSLEFFNYSALISGTWQVAGAFILLSYLIEMMTKHKPKRPLLFLYNDLRKHVLAPDLLVMRLAPLLMLILLMAAFTAFKIVVPIARPFSWDSTLSSLDRTLFLGTDPWRITHALFGGPLPTLLIHCVYNLWFFIMWLSVLYVTLRPDIRRVRTQYLLAFPLTWILLGSLMALFFSSAGPCYYAHVVSGPDPYHPLMARLHELDAHIRTWSPALGLHALDLQDMLWKLYLDREHALGGGISAMPSLHVGVATLVACLGFSFNRLAGWCLTVFAITIWIGSIHLGWHYAVDGLVSAPLAILIWRLSGWVAQQLAPIEFSFDAPLARPSSSHLTSITLSPALSLKGEGE